ncbi:MAG: hypothetical protein KKF89_00525 [Nanoarchaeota archaeon]|nr:hypothetical protein [Nanoarchaeota archaeon]MBU1854181.1 hypothetical protein [Nanoarchaeota archaeon]
MWAAEVFGWTPEQVRSMGFNDIQMLIRTWNIKQNKLEQEHKKINNKNRR